MTKTILAFFTDSGAPKTGLTPTIRIWDIGAGSLDVVDEDMTEVGDGFYNYNFTDYDEEKDYAIRMDGTATLSNTDRYLFAGNESYIEDIWGAKTGNHDIAGSFGSAVISSGGAVLASGEGGARPLTQEEMTKMAEKVWEVILDNNQNAKDVLLSKSEFDATKDKVTLKEPIDIQPIINVVFDLEKKVDDISSKQSKQLTESSLNSVISKVNELGNQVSSLKFISPELKNKMDTIINSLELTSDKLKNTIESNFDDFNSSVKSENRLTRDTVESLNKNREEFIKAANDVVDIWSRLATMKAERDVIDKTLKISQFNAKLNRLNGIKRRRR